MVNYLYNGIELPALPEWDRGKYPFALITIGNLTKTAYLYILSAVEFATNDQNAWSVTIPIGTPCAVAEKDATSWGSFEEMTYATAPSIVNIDWANFDVLNEDGTVYLAASDPIPVSTFTPDPMSLTMGWIVGRRIAGQRGKHIHQYIQEVTEPTCTEKGFTTYTCTCGDSYTADETDALGHEYVSEVIEPTTESEGYTLHTCSRCGDSYKDNYTDKIQGEPIAYLYNGVQLPSLPDVDTSSYPYCVIRRDSTSSMYDLFYSSNEPYKNTNIWNIYGPWYTVSFSEADVATKWNFKEDFTFGSFGDTDTRPVIWTNVDIPYYTDGTIYFVASDPVPVYES